MAGKNLLDKVWDLHSVRELPGGQTQLMIGLHLIHEVTSPQGFQMLEDAGLPVLMPGRTFATVDHIVPTDDLSRPLADPLAEEMLSTLEQNTEKHAVRFFAIGSGHQGVLHVVGPEMGLTQPGMTIACGDSHTSTHGAFGAIAFGIGTSQVRDVLASQCLALVRPKVRRIVIDGELGSGVTAKDVILHIIRVLGVKGGVGYAYEYAGSVVEHMTMEERMTLCNMSIEGGARVGYVNPDRITFDYLEGRTHAPEGEAFARAIEWWKTIVSDADASYDDEVAIPASDIAPTVTWGINPGHAISIGESLPRVESLPDDERGSAEEAYGFMQLEPGAPIAGTRINVAFIGSCTNGRLSDLREAAKIAQGRKVEAHVRALVVPGSELVKKQAEAEGLHEIFEAAGFEWREAGCSMCLAMNPDKLVGREMCASSSNRNFRGRQGSPTGRTLLMSPAMVAAAAVTGAVTDVREFKG
ncbi:MAG: 3-isopropylmalate dehydratase large subunit [bacterium]|nr:3-isopropylmalate dehydratase large subunit [bacterium]